MTLDLLPKSQPQTPVSKAPFSDYVAWLTCTCPVAQYCREASREDFRDYVAQLQLHMTLQARKLLPDLKNPLDSRDMLLQQTQADVERLVSRQS